MRLCPLHVSALGKNVLKGESEFLNEVIKLVIRIFYCIFQGKVTFQFIDTLIRSALLISRMFANFGVEYCSRSAMV